MTDEEFYLYYSFSPKFLVAIWGKKETEYRVQFMSEENVLYSSVIKSGEYAEYLRVEECEKLKIKITNLETKKEKIYKYCPIETYSLDTYSLGDILAWLPIVNEYAKLKNLRINLFLDKVKLFDVKKYPLINLIPLDFLSEDLVNEKNKIGVKSDLDLAIPLSELPKQFLDLDLKDYNVKPFLNTKFIKINEIDKKYVCIGIQSTHGMKYWHYEEGWFKLVEYLKSLGYEVLCIDRHKEIRNISSPDNCLDYTGKTLEEVINLIYHCEFFIGLSSGLSWLAWSLCKPVVMICGFLGSDYHFPTPYFVQNTSVCHNCWYDKRIEWDREDFFHCPHKKNFECSRMIDLQMVKHKINQCIIDVNFKL